MWPRACTSIRPPPCSAWRASWTVRPPEEQAFSTLITGSPVIPIKARASGGGRLFGSIGPADVVDAIKATKGIEVDRKHILLPEHIKETGSFEVTVELFRDVATIVTVEVSAAS